MVLIDTSSVAQIFPVWWMPSAENLAAIAPAQTHVKVRVVAVDDEGAADLSTATSLWVAVDEVDGEILKGTITASNINEEGFREGDRLETTTGHVWDFFQVGNDGNPELNQDRANAMLGKTVLVGITKEARSRQKPSTQSQVAGTIENIDSKGIRLRLCDGSAYDLPPDIRSFENALPGEYRLRSTGEVISDPDFTCTWTIIYPRLP
jgi:hypothetical protein